jgi:predicted flap endonuclease-1-like 5' DNA nuclease
MEICEIEGIGPAYGAKLERAGITSPASLLEKGATPEGREAIAKSTGIAEKLIRDWVNRVDLTRVNGIGPQFADLLEESGVDSIPALAQRNAANLYKKVVQVNEARNLASRTPSLSEVERWIREAKGLPRVVTH